MRRVRGADHAEQGLLALHAVDRPARVEDLVPAVLGVRLREHHQLDVGRVASGAHERLEQVVDLVGRQREAQLAIGRLERGAPVATDRDVLHRLARQRREEGGRVRRVEQRRLGHPVVKGRGERRELGRLELLAADQARQQAAAGLDAEFDAALDAAHAGHPAVVRDVGGLAGPGRHGAQPRNDPDRLAARGRRVGRDLEQRREPRLLVDRERLVAPDRVDEARVESDRAHVDAAQLLEQASKAELGQRGLSSKHQVRGHGAVAV